MPYVVECKPEVDSFHSGHFFAFKLIKKTHLTAIVIKCVNVWVVLERGFVCDV